MPRPRSDTDTHYAVFRVSRANEQAGSLFDELGHLSSVIQLNRSGLA
jgi:hypothetical protein